MDKWPIYTPVRHRIENYAGWIDPSPTTNMKELFTGNKDCEWQYRIYVYGLEKRKIAPPEDLERIDSGAEFPPFLVKNTWDPSIHIGNCVFIPNPDYTGEKKFIEETQLHALGYRISGMNYSERWSILYNVAIPVLGLEAVIRTIIAVAGLRVCNEAMAEKHRYALLEWHKDLSMILDKFGDSEELKNTWLRESIYRFFDTLKMYKIIDGNPRPPQWVIG